MYISSLEIHISRLEIELSSGIGNFFCGFYGAQNETYLSIQH